MKTTRRLWVLLPALALLAACGGDDDATDTTDATDDEAPAATETPTGDACDPLPTYEPDTLTVATGEPVFEPWMVDDDPANGQGFESALVYALAERLGFEADAVDWVRTGFDEAIAPGEKPYDFNIQQYSISEERAEVVGFSIGYYQVEQAIIADPENPVASAQSLADLKSARLGAAIATTSLDYIDNVIQPDSPAQVYNDNAAAKLAFDGGQVDGIVFDLPTAYYITAVEIPDAAIVGVLPRVGESPEELGLLFEKDDPLIECVNPALQALHDDGTIAALEDEWLAPGGDIPTLDQSPRV
ncbi:MAG TPA: transporter substrate-binding domain-containing protein [Jiangellaceae bacterium]|nr:transporter substrate-binding domain-containing protein [Jiangellaceae bacterium]